MSYLVLLVLLVVAIIFLINLFKKPIRFILKMLLNAVIGYVVLFFINFFGSWIGLELDITLLNVLITGILGIPGIILLIVLQFLL